MTHILQDMNHLEWIMKQPEVFPHLGFSDYDSIDINKFVNHRVTILANEDETAVSLWEESSPGIFEAHSLFTNDCRGRDAIRVGSDMIEWMIINKDPLLLWGQTPVINKAANWWNRQVGLKYITQVEDPNLNMTMNFYALGSDEVLDTLRTSVASLKANEQSDSNQKFD